MDGDPVDEAVLGMSDDCVEIVHCSPEFYECECFTSSFTFSDKISAPLTSNHHEHVS